MAQSEEGRHVFDGLCEDGRVVISQGLLETGQIASAEAFTKESSAGVSIQEQLSKTSSASLSVSTSNIKESSAGLTVWGSKTKESSAGLAISGGGSKASSAGLTIFIQPATGWLSGYKYRKKGAANSTTAGTQTNYQMKLIVGESSGAGGADVDCDGHCQNFPNDIRFTKENGITKHDYWIDSSSLEGTTPNRKVNVVIEVASIPASGSIGFYMYYGKSGDSGASNGDATFEFFDDFEGSELDSPQTEGDVLVSGYAGKYEAWPGIAKDEAGNLYAFYRTSDSNTHGFDPTGRAVIRKSTDDGQTWSSEVTVLDHANLDNRTTASILVFDDDGTETILCIANKYDDSPHIRVTYAIKSTDGGDTWGTPIEICPGCSLSHPAGAPILTSQNKLLVPLCIDKATSWKEAIAESEDGGDSWTIYDVTGINSTRNEWSIIETKTGGAYTGGMYGIFRRDAAGAYDYKTSTDYGHTWSSFSEETDLPVEVQPNPCFLFRLSNGKILAAYTRTTKRLVVYESDDECSTWSYKKDVVTTQSISYYPAIVEISSSELIFVWCVNGSGSDVYINYENYPLIGSKWILDEGTASVSNSILSLNSNPTYLVSCDKVYKQPMILSCRAKFSDDDEQQHIWGTSDNTAGNIHNNSVGFLKYSLLRKQVRKVGNETSQNDAHEGLGSYHNYSVHWRTDEAKFYDDGILKATLTTNVPTVDLYLLLRRSGASAFNIDWTYTSKYASPEPTWGAWGVEVAIETKESSAGVSVQEQLSKTSSASLSVSTSNIKESSAGLTVWGSKTKESSAGVSIQEQLSKTSSASLSVSTSNIKESSAGLTVWGSKTKESSAGLAIADRIIKTSSAGITISEGTKLISSAGVTIQTSIFEKGLFYGKLGNTILETLDPESFRISEEINRIPSFEFEVANTESNRIAIAANATELFRIYWQHHGIDTLIFTGIINVDGIEYVSLSSIRITGFASYAKLGWPLYKHLNSEDAEPVNTVLDYHSGYTDYTIQANNAAINDVTVDFGNTNYCFYVGEANPFWGLQVKYSTKGIPAGAEVVIEFSKGGGIWAPLDVLDETNAFTEDPGTYDVIIPHPPSDWARNTVNGVSKFWIRWRIVSGAYTTSPKLDRIYTVNVDVYRVFYLATSAREILLDVLEDTEYTMDAVDACPEDEINLYATYESPLRVIASIPAALTWTDIDGSKKSYQWWVDDAKKVHMKRERGTTYNKDITGNLTIFNNLVDYFNVSNRIIGFGPRDGLSQIRAIVENKASQTTHALREIAVPKNEIGKYQTLRASLEKDITYSKDPMQRIKGSVTTEFWTQEGYEVGDRVTLHQGEWVVEEGVFQIVKADIGPLMTSLNLGISREHLEGLKSNLKRAFDISNVQMHGSTSLLTAGPETSNYERKADGTVFSSKLKFEIPTEVTKTHKVLLSWTIGPYRASVNDSTGHIPDHDHGGNALIGGDIDSDFTGEDGGFTPDVALDGGFTPQMLSEAHKHGATAGAITYEYKMRMGWLPISPYVEYENVHVHSNPDTGNQSRGHTHSLPNWTGSPDDDDIAVMDGFGIGSSCGTGWCVTAPEMVDVPSDTHWHSLGGNTGGISQSHTHSQGNTGIDTSQYGHRHRMSTGTGDSDPEPYMFGPFTLNLDLWQTKDEDPAHIHEGEAEDDHDHVGVEELDHDHSTVAIPGHDDHLISLETGASAAIDYGIHEEPAGTVLEVVINGEILGEYSGDQTEIRIDGYLSGGTQTIEIRPITSEINKKGGATIWAAGIAFYEPKHF